MGRGSRCCSTLLASSLKPLSIRELPYTFRERQRGESKLDLLIGWEYVMLLAGKLIGHIVPLGFALFALIGGLGLLVHLAALWIGLNIVWLGFRARQSVATVVAMTSDFVLNNQFSYRDRRLNGIALWRGLVVFYLICGLGAVANVGVASYAFTSSHTWWLAGVAGTVVGSAWSFAMSSAFTWRR